MYCVCNNLCFRSLDINGQDCMKASNNLQKYEKMYATYLPTSERENNGDFIKRHFLTPYEVQNNRKHLNYRQRGV